MGPKTASALALLAVAAAIECPDETWLKLNDKCYSKQASGTHAECATICGANASLVHITSKLENDFARFVVDGDVWIGLYKLMHPLHPHRGRWTSSQEIAEMAYANWKAGEPYDERASRGFPISDSQEPRTTEEVVTSHARLAML